MTVEPSPARVPGTLLALLVMGLAWAVLQLWGLGLTPFHTRGEPREAVVVQDLVAHNRWILPRRNAVELPRKPPLFYWLAGAAAGARGAVDEASVRLPSAVQSGVAALLVTGAAAATIGPVAGGAAGVVLLSSFEWLRAATAARVDMTLAFGLTLVFVGLLLFRLRERTVWLCLVYVGAAWATLAKGIPGLAIPVLQIALLCVIERSLLRLAAATDHRRAGGAVVCGARYAAAAAQGGREFLHRLEREHHARRQRRRWRARTSPFVALPDRHAPARCCHGRRCCRVCGRIVARPRPDRPMGSGSSRSSGCWLCSSYVFAASKRGVYLFFPAVAFLLGWWGSRLLHGHVMAPWLARLLTPLAWLLASLLGILGIGAAAQALGLPLLDATVALLPTRTAIDLRPIAAAATWPLAAALLIAAIAAATLASTAARGRWRIALPALVVSLVAVVVGARGTILPAIGAAQSRREFAQALRRAVVDPADVHTIGGLDYGTLFYWGAPIEVYDPANAGQQPPYLVLPELAWLRMPLTVRRHYRRVPGLTVEHGGDEGYVAVLQRTGEPHTLERCVSQTEERTH
jgi:hypothetical protein